MALDSDAKRAHLSLELGIVGLRSARNSVDKLRMRFEKLPLSMLPAKIIRGLHRMLFPLLGERLYTAGSRLRETLPGRPRFVIRVDDYPRWDMDTREFLGFHDVFYSRRAPYLLGVTPFLSFGKGETHEFSGFELDLLSRLVVENVELGVHGFTHQERMTPHGHPCETYFYDDETLRSEIGRAFKWFAEKNLPRPEHYIPPFNTLSSRDFDILAAHFPVVHGGALSLSTLGKFALSRDTASGVTYAPSFVPLYQRSEQVLEFLRRGEKRLTRALLHCITLHWAWERASGYRHVGPLIDFLLERGWLADPAALHPSSEECVG